MSRAAVSKVLRNAYGVSDAMRVRVTAAMTELNYRPRIAARAMRGRTYTLGIELPDLANHFFARIVRGATGALEGTPYQLIIAPAEAGSRRGAARTGGAGGPAGRRRHRRVAPCRRGGAGAHLGVGAGRDVRAARHVRPLRRGRRRRRGRRAGRDATSARTWGTRTSPTSRCPSPAAPSRFPTACGCASIGAAMAAAGHGDRAVRRGAPTRARRNSYEVVRAHARGRNACRRPCSRLTTNSRSVRCVPPRSAGRHLSVVGYDDVPMASHPALGLTTVHQPGEAMGARAVEMLLERFAGRTEPVHEVFEIELKVRSRPRRPDGAAPPQRPPDEAQSSALTAPASRRAAGGLATLRHVVLSPALRLGRV